MVVFLDFDGVVHPEGLQDSSQLFCRLPLIEEVLREFQIVEIVISSAWRLEYREPVQAVIELRAHFSADIAPRILGVTPQCVYLTTKNAPAGLTKYDRHWECEAWMQTHRAPGTRWMALDDRTYLFEPNAANLMAFDLNEAFTAAHQDKLREFLTALVDGTSWPDPY